MPPITPADFNKARADLAGINESIRKFTAEGWDVTTGQKPDGQFTMKVSRVLSEEEVIDGG